MRRILTFGFLIACIALNALADEKLETLKSIYAGEMDKIVANYLGEMKVVNNAYAKYLNSELEKAKNRGDLDAYGKVSNEKKRFEQEATLPDESPVEKLVARAEYRKNVAVIGLSRKYLAGLNAHKIALMKSDDIEGARAVQSEIDEVEGQLKKISAEMPVATNSRLTPEKPEPKPERAAVMIPLDNRTVEDVAIGKRIWTDRDYVFANIPKELKEKKFILSGISLVAAECKEGGVVYVFAQSIGAGPVSRVNDLIEDGFSLCDIPDFQLTADSEGKTTVLKKEVKKGDTVKVKKWGVIVF